MTHPIVIVGCGPAGLAAASVIRTLNPSRELIIIDAGEPLSSRSRYDPQHLISGVGGAGLFSDGKFSFFPSASLLWSSLDAERLIRAYQWLQSTLAALDIQTPALREAPSTKASAGFKSYPSIYVSEERRHKVIASLYALCEAQSLNKTKVIEVATDSRGGLSLRIEHNGAQKIISASAVLFAGGRFAPLQRALRQAPVQMQARRTELGLRVEGPSTHPFFTSLRTLGASIDPKLILQDSSRGIEWRTFCFCHEGEVVAAQYDELWSLSGRADCPPTGRSNVGVNVRFRERPKSFSFAQLNGVLPFEVSLQRFIEGDDKVVTAAYGAEISAALREGFLRIADSVRPSSSSSVILGQGVFDADPGIHLRPSFRASVSATRNPSGEEHQMDSTYSIEQGLTANGSLGTVCFAKDASLCLARSGMTEGVDALVLRGPVIEGVDAYPIVARDLSVGPGLYVAGDACGLFRGLVAALVSGAYAGEVLSSL